MKYEFLSDKHAYLPGLRSIFTKFSAQFVSGYTISITRVIAPIGTSVMKINMKMVTLSKMYGYNFTLEKKLVFNYLYVTQNSPSLFHHAFLFQYDTVFLFPHRSCP